MAAHLALLDLADQQTAAAFWATVVFWIAAAGAVASYGGSRGFPFFPLFLTGLLPFPGWPLVLLAVTVAPSRTND